MAQKKSSKKNPKKKKKPAKKTARKSVRKTARKSVRRATRKTGGKTVAKKKKKTPARKAKKSGKPASASALMATGPVVGALAPGFMLKNQRGETISLDQYRGKPVVLYFYPKDDTPGCTAEACDFRDNIARAASKGAVVLGISRDDEASHQRFAEKYQLPFDLLADTDGRVCELYGAWREKSMYGKTFMGIVRMTYIIDAEGRVKKIYPKVSVTGHVDDVLANL